MPRTTIRDLDRVVLLEDVAEDGLRAGDVGTVVYVHGGGRAFEVEFVAQSGHTVALRTLARGQVRGMAAGEVTIARAHAA